MTAVQSKGIQTDNFLFVLFLDIEPIPLLSDDRLDDRYDLSWSGIRFNSGSSSSISFGSFGISV